MFYDIMGTESSETTSNYAFYVNLENTDGLILGEHIFIEPDKGQGNVKEGLWLKEFYIIQDENGSYVWTENKKGKIEKRKVTLGEYDEDLMEYKITAGLSNKDYIAFPENRIKEGMKTTRNKEDVKVYEDEAPDEIISEDMVPEDMMLDEEGMIDEEDISYDEDGNIILENGLKMDTEGNLLDENGLEIENISDGDVTEDAESGEEEAN